MTLVNRDALEILLQRVKRTQNINGKPQDQVHSCILRHDAKQGRISATTLVKDGVSSVSRFSCPSQGYDGIYYVPNINILLGALKYHGGNVSLDGGAEKLRLKSSNKQTTLTASAEALAFPHSPKTLGEWETTSMGVANNIVETNLTWNYIMKSGEKRRPTHYWEVNALALYEALRCDSMNGQKINRYKFLCNGDTGKLAVEVGKTLKGQTKTTFTDGADDANIKNFRGEDTFFQATFEGGLEHLLSNVGGNVGLHFFDFTKEGQGHKLLFDFGNRDFVFQSEILR
jgi:hypothetical protein